MKGCVLLAILLLTRLMGQSRLESIGPFGGSAAIVEVDLRRPHTVLAATSNALLFRSTNDGDSWTRLPFPAELRAALHAMFIVPATGVYLVGLADDNHEYNGIWQSSDAGRSWKRSRALERKNIWSLAVWPLDPHIIAAGADDGLFLTRDGGQSWRRISPESNPALTPVVSLAFDTTDYRTIYVGTPHLSWRTTDEGITWASIHNGMPDDSDVFSIHIDETRPLCLFASACSGIYHSANQGDSWTKLAGPSDASFRTYQIIQDPEHPEVLFAGTAHGLIRSTDRGKTWRKMSGYTTRWITFDRARAGRIFIATDEAGILRSDDLGNSLTAVNEGFCNRRVLSFAVSKEAIYTSLAADSTSGGILRRTGSAHAWETLAATPRALGKPVFKMMSPDGSHLYALTPTNLLRSADGGKTWTPIFLPSSIPTLTTMLDLAEGERLLVGTEGGLWYTPDAGKVWLAAGSPARSAVKSLAILGPQSIAAITSSGLLLSHNGIDYRAVAVPDVPSQIFGLTVTERGSWLAATAHGLARSDNFGATWQRVPGVLDGVTVSAICKHPSRRGVLFASSYGAVFESEDDGRSWRAIMREEVALPGIKEIVMARGIPDAIFALTHNQGVYVISYGAALTNVGSSSPGRGARSTPVSGRAWPPF